LQACWAHARRKFADIIKSSKSNEQSKQLANDAIVLIKKLYKVEKEIKDDPPNKKELIRKEKLAQRYGGAIAKAFVYLNNQFSKLIVYLEDGKLNIDNNKAENHIRPIALGRKNWLFATSVKGASAIATWYSIIETAKANGLEPYSYLKYLMTEFPIYQSEGKNIEPLLPWNVNQNSLG